MRRTSSILIICGLALIAVSINIIIFTFYPVLLVEIKYLLTEHPKNLVVESQNDKFLKNVISPIDEGFGIVIPKIGANARIIADVDPFDAKVYQLVLTRGVAHARGTALPGSGANIFLFSHSAINFYEANRYNSVFYLLSKLEKGDEIYMFYQKEKFKYAVIDKEIVSASQVSYLKGSASRETITLMTCWPAGTTFKRLIITAQIQSD